MRFSSKNHTVHRRLMSVHLECWRSEYTLARCRSLVVSVPDTAPCKDLIEYEVLNTPVPVDMIKRASKKFQSWVVRCLQRDPALRPTSTELHRDPWIREYPG